MALIGQAVSEEKIFENGGRRTDGRTTEHGYTISSPCEPDGSGELKTEGVMLRARCRYEELGEKPSGYFLNLENRNFMDKVINKLVDANGKENNDSLDILNLQRQYYHDLYKADSNLDDVPLNEVIGENSSKLNEEESLSLEGEITYEELGIALKNMKNSKAQVWMDLRLSSLSFFG